MKLKLIDCINKNVRITTTDNQIFEGKAYDFIPSQDNVPEIASISIDDIEFFENDIAHIEILK